MHPPAPLLQAPLSYRSVAITIFCEVVPSGGVESHCHSLLVWTIPQNAVFEQDRDHDRNRETADLVTLFCRGFQVRGFAVRGFRDFLEINRDRDFLTVVFRDMTFM